MVTLVGLLRTLIVSSQPLKCLPYQDSKTIRFRNGWKLNLTFPQFREIRDSYSAIKKHKLTQLDKDLFEADFGSFKVTADLQMVCTFADILYRYKVTQLGPDEYRVEGDEFTLEGSSAMLFCFRELVVFGVYKTNYKDKVVLDIGGFNGETAVYFWLSGAKKNIIYEPFSKYCRIIENNIKLNSINAEIHNAGIGDKDGQLLMDIFRLDEHEASESKKELIKIKNITDIINTSGADIAKIDCEGAEACLATVPDEVLRKISSYMLEIHSAEIQRDLTAKFTHAGFKVTKLQKNSSEISIAYFHL